MPKEKNKTKTHILSDEIDSPKDRKKMNERVTKMRMPDAREIPGQEHIRPMPIGELSDVTVASSDEEGDDAFNNNIDREVREQKDANISEQERKDLFESANDMPGDDERLRIAGLDDTDEDGTPLNEDSFDKDISPDDLDVPGSSLDDNDEQIGEEDEENNEYSLGNEETESQNTADS